MTVALSLTEAATLTAVRTFLLSILAPSVEVVRGQVNRVPEVRSPDFVVQTPVWRDRLSTNVDAYSDCAFTASISGTSMVVTSVQLGTLTIGNTVFGVGVAADTLITDGPSGGGEGTYTVSVSQTVGTETMACGSKTMTQNTRVTIQWDVHGPNSGDNAQILTTMMRDGYMVDQMAGTGVTPLNADEAKQIPFIDGEAQYENRWILSADFQVNPSVVVPLQFASALEIVLKETDTYFPPS